MNINKTSLKRLTLNALFFGMVVGYLMFLNIYPVLANCIYNGKKYPEGARIGPYVCRDGDWHLERTSK